MKQIEALFENINKSAKCFSIKKNRLSITIKNSTFDGKGVYELLSNLKFIASSSYKDAILDINILAYQISDDSVIQQIEIALAYIFEHNVKMIRLSFNKLRPSSAHYSFVQKSVFSRLGNSFTKKKYLKEFYNESFSSRDYFRYYVKKEKLQDIENRIMSDIFMYARFRKLDITFCKRLSNAFTEIIDNVRHADCDCIATIKYSDSLINKQTKKRASAFCLSVTNISNVSITTNLESQIQKDQLKGATKDIIDKSLKNHMKFFGKNGYSIKKYCLISVFQNKITTNSLDDSSGGTGLTQLIQTLNNSDFLLCYVCSEDNILYFKKELIKMNDDGYIGFNKENDYIGSPPDDSIFVAAPFKYQGTLFLLEIFKESQYGN